MVFGISWVRTRYTLIQQRHHSVFHELIRNIWSFIENDVPFIDSWDKNCRIYPRFTPTVFPHFFKPFTLETIKHWNCIGLAITIFLKVENKLFEESSAPAPHKCLLSDKLTRLVLDRARIYGLSRKAHFKVRLLPIWRTVFNEKSNSCFYRDGYAHVQYFRFSKYPHFYSHL